MRKLLSLCFIFTLMACSNGDKDKALPRKSWSKLIERVGTFSSPRAADLTGDGILDIVMGIGKVEFQYTDSAVIAFNGASGGVLWITPARDQIFGSASFMDITADSIPDVFIGGRSAEFMAINGKNGQIVWEFFPQGDSTDGTSAKLYNFYNPQFIRDVDGDGLRDIVVANGGYVKAPPNDPNRPAGKLMILQGATGRLIAEAYMPDGKETYMSCIVYDPAAKNPRVIFGSGGERIKGNLYLTTINDILSGDISRSTVLVHGKQKGFIAPPVLVDINGDHVNDIVANAVDGKMIALDGVSHKVLWEMVLPNTEAYCSIAIGKFNSDSIPDFFTNFGIGIFPDLLRSYQIAVSGKDGSKIKLDSLGSFHYASPVVYDFDGNGIDEVLYHVNETNLGMVKNFLAVFDFVQDTVYHFLPGWNGGNVGSTPLLVDVDHDAYLDVVCSHENNPVDLFSNDFKTGLWVRLIKTNVPLTKPVRWGSYMGSSADGLYHTETP